MDDPKTFEVCSFIFFFPIKLGCRLLLELMLQRFNALLTIILICLFPGLKISGLDTFGQRVLFAKVIPESDDLFWQFVGLVLDKLAKSSPAIGLTNKFDLTPHLTLVKVNRPISKLRKSKFLPSRLYEKFSDLEFGVQVQILLIKLYISLKNNYPMSLKRGVSTHLLVTNFFSWCVIFWHVNIAQKKSKKSKKS
jgi:hypothetical protein